MILTKSSNFVQTLKFPWRFEIEEFSTFKAVVSKNGITLLVVSIDRSCVFELCWMLIKTKGKCSLFITSTRSKYNLVVIPACGLIC